MISVVLLFFNRRKVQMNMNLSEVDFSVELEGFEPSSKQGTSMLSTCLFRPSFSSVTKTRTTKLRLIFFRFHPGCEANRD